MKFLYVLVFVFMVCYAKAKTAKGGSGGGSTNATKHTKHTGEQTMHEKTTKLPAMKTGMKAAGMKATGMMRERELVWVKVPHAHARWILV